MKTEHGMFIRVSQKLRVGLGRLELVHSCNLPIAPTASV